MIYLKTFESSAKMYSIISSDEYYDKTGGNLDDREEGLSFIKNNFEKIPDQEINRIQNVVSKVELYHGLLGSGIPKAEYNTPSTDRLMIQMKATINIFFKRNKETPFHTTIIVIYKLKDEYFYIYDTISGEYFKCDTVSGILQFVKDNSNTITDYLEDSI